MERYHGLKKGSEDFEVPVGRFDGVKVYELVGTFVLNKLRNVSKTTYLVYIEITLFIWFGS